MEAGPLDELFGHSITYRIGVGPQKGRKVFTLQTLPSCNEPFDNSVGKVARFSILRSVNGTSLCHSSFPMNLSRRVRPNSAHRARVTPAKRGKGNKAGTSDAPEDTTPAERRAAMSLGPSA